MDQMKEIKIPISLQDNYVLDTFVTDRNLKGFNRSIRSISVPIGDFHEPLHDQAIFDTDPSNRGDISHLANLFSIREPRYNGAVTGIELCNDTNAFIAKVNWWDKMDPPESLRITAILKGKRCIRVLQFGVT